MIFLSSLPPFFALILVLIVLFFEEKKWNPVGNKCFYFLVISVSDSHIIILQLCNLPKLVFRVDLIILSYSHPELHWNANRVGPVFTFLLLCSLSICKRKVFVPSCNSQDCGQAIKLIISHLFILNIIIEYPKSNVWYHFLKKKK